MIKLTGSHTPRPTSAWHITRNCLKRAAWTRTARPPPGTRCTRRPRTCCSERRRWSDRNHAPGASRRLLRRRPDRGAWAHCARLHSVQALDAVRFRTRSRLCPGFIHRQLLRSRGRQCRRRNSSCGSRRLLWHHAVCERNFTLRHRNDLGILRLLNRSKPDRDEHRDCGGCSKRRNRKLPASIPRRLRRHARRACALVGACNRRQLRLASRTVGEMRFQPLPLDRRDRTVEVSGDRLRIGALRRRRCRRLAHRTPQDCVQRLAISVGVLQGSHALSL